MTADDLIDIAFELARRDVGRPRQASLKRAVSTAYYALFHALAYECVDQTIGWRFRSEMYWETVSPLYRAIDHGAVKSVFSRVLNEAGASADLKQVARTLIDLQAERIRADYDPRPAFTRETASQVIGRAARAIGTLRGLSDEAKRLVAVQLLAKSR